MKALKSLINLYLLQQRPQAAIGILEDTLKTAITINTPNNQVIDVTSVQLLLGEVYVSEKRNSEAISLYDQIIKNNPQDFRPLLAKAFLLKETEQIDTAKSLFQSALELAPPQYKDQIKQLEKQLQN
jgi:tetratricopeptide (TPR) repeat protein